MPTFDPLIFKSNISILSKELYQLEQFSYAIISAGHQTSNWKALMDLVGTTLDIVANGFPRSTCKDRLESIATSDDRLANITSTHTTNILVQTLNLTRQWQPPSLDIYESMAWLNNLFALVYNVSYIWGKDTLPILGIHQLLPLDIINVDNNYHQRFDDDPIATFIMVLQLHIRSYLKVSAKDCKPKDWFFNSILGLIKPSKLVQRKQDANNSLMRISHHLEIYGSSTTLPPRVFKLYTWTLAAIVLEIHQDSQLDLIARKAFLKLTDVIQLSHLDCSDNDAIYIIELLFTVGKRLSNDQDVTTNLRSLWSMPVKESRRESLYKGYSSPPPTAAQSQGQAAQSPSNHSRGGSASPSTPTEYHQVLVPWIRLDVESSVDLVASRRVGYSSFICMAQVIKLNDVPLDLEWSDSMVLKSELASLMPARVKEDLANPLSVLLNGSVPIVLLKPVSNVGASSRYFYDVISQLVAFRTTFSFVFSTGQKIYHPNRVVIIPYAMFSADFNLIIQFVELFKQMKESTDKWVIQIHQSSYQAIRTTNTLM
eukprot:gene14930-17654_t